MVALYIDDDGVIYTDQIPDSELQRRKIAKNLDTIEKVFKVAADVFSFGMFPLGRKIAGG